MTNLTTRCSNEKQKPFRVLSLDGGGMRGLYMIAILKSLCERFCKTSEKDIGKGFDLIVGTSTGGIIATGLVAGVNIEKIMDIYKKEGKRIFTKPVPKYPLKDSFIKYVRWVLCNIRKPANSNDHLRNVLSEIFQDETLKGVYDKRKIGLCLTSVNLINSTPRVFKTPHNPAKHADDKRRLVDICLATSSVPILFPVALISEPDNEESQGAYLDGGLYANNPVLFGLIEALELSEKKQDIEILSIGACPPPHGYAVGEKETDKGIWYWKFGVQPLEIAMDVQSSAFDFMCEFLAKRFREFGKNIKICRLKGENLSQSQEKFLGIDRADKEACDILIKKGTEYGKSIHGKVLRTHQDEKLIMIKNIFEDIGRSTH